MPLNVVDTLCELVRIPSVNPMGRPVSGNEFYEESLTDHLETVFRKLGLPVERQPIAPRRTNIQARLDGSTAPSASRPLIVFEAHQDTVPVDGMVIPPWTPECREGRVYGRGSCDVKGGMACMIAALSRLAEERPAGMPDIVMACSVNEEHGFSGARDMARRWGSGESKLVPRVPDAVVVAEPTQLDVVVAHKGVVRWRCHTRGRAVHSSVPEQGDNAIYHMARVLASLENYAQQVAPRLGQHPRVGSPTLSVGLIQGGISVNTVPDECTIEIDRRILPEEDWVEARRQVVAFVGEQCRGFEIVHDEPFLAGGGLCDHQNLDLARELSGVVQSHHRRGAIVGVPYGTDATHFAAVGAPTVVFGPGAIAQAHTNDEWIAVEQLQLATEILCQFARRGRIGSGQNTSNMK